MTYKFIVNALNPLRYAVRKKFWEKNGYEIIHVRDFMVCFDMKYVTKWRCLIPP